MSKNDIEKIEQKVNNAVASAKAKGEDVASDVISKVRDRAQYVKGKAESLGADICAYVEENPWKALGVGVIAGFLISKVLDFRK